MPGRSAPPHALPPDATVRPGGNRQALLKPQFQLGPPALAPELPVLLGIAAFKQKLIQNLKILHLRHRHKEIRPGVLRQTLHLALLVSATDIAEMAVKKIVAAELEEALGQ